MCHAALAEHQQRTGTTTKRSPFGLRMQSTVNPCASRHEANDLFNAPDMIGYPSFHCGRHSEGREWVSLAPASCAASSSRHLGVRFLGSGVVVVSNDSTSASMFFSAFYQSVITMLRGGHSATADHRSVQTLPKRDTEPGRHDPPLVAGEFPDSDERLHTSILT